ncbi:MAG TPA: hypothetical protein VLE23_12800 [Geminicoccaceae bacterium]|nr:hypothetical protein [Geminicoccaceae bacterium]
MSSALGQFEALALNGRPRYSNHPVLSWCASHAIVIKDAAGNRNWIAPGRPGASTAWLRR